MSKLIGLIDEDWESRGKMTFPNLSLMKLAAWHRQQGDTVGWYSEIMGTFDRVYCSRVFSEEYTRPYALPINAHEVVRGGVRVRNHCHRRPGALRQVQGSPVAAGN